MSQKVPIAKGQDWTIEFRVRAGDGHGNPIRVRLTADAASGATSLTIDGKHPALASSDELLFGEDFVVALSGACAAGVQTLSVTAIAGPLRSGDVLEKLQDLTGYTIQMEVLSRAGDATPLIASSDVTVTLATQTAADRGKVQVAGLAATTASLDAGSYYAALWRRNAATARPLAEVDFELSEEGFL